MLKQRAYEGDLVVLSDNENPVWHRLGCAAGKRP